MKQSQADVLENILSDRQWHNGIELANALGGGCAAYRSRISCDLKPRLLKKNLTIESRKSDKSKIWDYRIVDLNAPKYVSDDTGQISFV